MKTINLFLILCLSYFLFLPNITGQYSSEITHPSLGTSASDATCEPCSGNQLIVGTINNTLGNGSNHLLLTLHQNGSIISSMRYPNVAATDQYRFNEVQVEPIITTTGTCDGYIVAFATYIVGPPSVQSETHIMRFDPNLNVVWHKSLGLPVGVSTTVKDLVLESTTGIVLHQVNNSSTALISIFDLTFGSTLTTQNLEMVDGNTRLTLPTTIIPLPTGQNYAGAYALVGSSFELGVASRKTFVAFLSPTLSINSIGHYDMDNGINFSENEARGAVAANGAIYITGQHWAFNDPGIFFLVINGANGIIAPGELLFIKRYTSTNTSINYPLLYDMAINGNNDGLIIGGNVYFPGSPDPQLGFPLLFELDFSGNIIWSKTYTHSYQSRFVSIDVNPTGICAVGSLVFNSFHVKTNVDGTISPTCDTDYTLTMPSITSTKLPLTYNANSYSYSVNTQSFSSESITLSQADCAVAPACPTIINLNGTIADGTYHAISTVNADGIVPAGGIVICKAGVEINLDINFEVLLNADFEAIIETCQ